MTEPEAGAVVEMLNTCERPAGGGLWTALREAMRGQGGGA